MEFVFDVSHFKRFFCLKSFYWFEHCTWNLINILTEMDESPVFFYDNDGFIPAKLTGMEAGDHKSPRWKATLGQSLLFITPFCAIPQKDPQFSVLEKKIRWSRCGLPDCKNSLITLWSVSIVFTFPTSISMQIFNMKNYSVYFWLHQQKYLTSPIHTFISYEMGYKPMCNYKYVNCVMLVDVHK